MATMTNPTEIAEIPQHAADAPSEQEIATRAHELYLERGAEQGRELDDWLRAEEELKARYHSNS
jgi:hypothetical protein